MPFLYKETQINKNAPLYSVGLTKNILIAGLGNIGKNYDNTRHNVGFMCIDEFVIKNNFDNWVNKKDLHTQMTGGRIGDTRVITIKPTTLMNLSGDAVEAVMSFYKLSLKELLVIHDDIDLPFGQIRTRLGGSSAGHNGINSIIDKTGDDFARIRIGVKNEKLEQIDSADFVLGKFTKEEQKHLKSISNEVTAIITEIIFGGSFSQETRNVIF